MKCISQDSPSLCNNQMNGVGLGTDGADALKKHFSILMMFLPFHKTRTFTKIMNQSWVGTTL